MEGIIFYWISWMVWIIATFFMDRTNKYRFLLSAWILLFIMLSPWTINIFNFKTGMAGLFLLVSLYVYAGRLKGRSKLYFLFCTFILMMAYVTFHLFELFDPVWVMFSRKWMLSVLLVYMAVLLQKNRMLRLPLILLGGIQGEVLYAIIIKSFSFPYTIGSLAFLDIMAISISISALWIAVHWAVKYIEANFKHLEREKQKLS
ncbi:putative membrane protein [Bacillus sp. ZZV12-4809]|nr:putative membrane protein [Bacillus sp. ZZV12-4809]